MLHIQMANRFFHQFSYPVAQGESPKSRKNSLLSLETENKIAADGTTCEKEPHHHHALLLFQLATLFLSSCDFRGANDVESCGR